MAATEAATTTAAAKTGLLAKAGGAIKAAAASSAAVPVVGGVGATAALVASVRAGATSSESKAYDRAAQALEQAGWSDVDLSKVVYELYTRGKLDPTEYKKAISILDETQAALKDGFGKGGLKELWTDDKYYFGHTTFTHNEVKRLLDKIAEEAPELAITLKRLSNEDGMGSLANIPAVANAPEPGYLDTNFEGYQRDVDPVKWWTGQELADLHGINYNPDNYYDLVKAGTSANVDYTHYLSDQANHSTMVNDTYDNASYLDAIRNNKAEALATGATIGARAANEVLSNINALNNYATTQNEAFTNRFNLVDDMLNQDANANVTAHDYFTQLGQKLADDSEGLYYNDTTRYGGDWNANAILYQADQLLRGTRAKANASMYANYLDSQARINQARGGMQDTANEYSWVFNNFVNAGYTPAQAYANTDEYLLNKNTGAKNLQDFLDNIKN